MNAERSVLSREHPIRVRTLTPHRVHVHLPPRLRTQDGQLYTVVTDHLGPSEVVGTAARIA